jgi:hypothetical protein
MVFQKISQRNVLVHCPLIVKEKSMDIKQYKLFIGIKYSAAKVSFSESHGLQDNTASVTEGVQNFVSDIK